MTTHIPPDAAQIFGATWMRTVMDSLENHTLRLGLIEDRLSAIENRLTGMEVRMRRLEEGFAGFREESRQHFRDLQQLIEDRIPPLDLSPDDD